MEVTAVALHGRNHDRTCGPRADREDRGPAPDRVRDPDLGPASGWAARRGPRRARRGARALHRFGRHRDDRGRVDRDRLRNARVERVALEVEELAPALPGLQVARGEDPTTCHFRASGSPMSRPLAAPTPRGPAAWRTSLLVTAFCAGAGATGRRGRGVCDVADC